MSRKQLRENIITFVAGFSFMSVILCAECIPLCLVWLAVFGACVFLGQKNAPAGKNPRQDKQTTYLVYNNETEKSRGI